jgi:hypothetical protein
MHDLIVAAAFALMILLPCLMGSRSGATEEAE